MMIGERSQGRRVMLVGVAIGEGECGRGGTVRRGIGDGSGSSHVRALSGSTIVRWPGTGGTAGTKAGSKAAHHLVRRVHEQRRLQARQHGNGGAHEHRAALEDEYVPHAAGIVQRQRLQEKVAEQRLQKGGRRQAQPLRQVRVQQRLLQRQHGQRALIRARHRGRVGARVEGGRHRLVQQIRQHDEGRRRRQVQQQKSSNQLEVWRKKKR